MLSLLISPVKSFFIFTTVFPLHISIRSFPIISISLLKFLSAHACCVYLYYYLLSIFSMNIMISALIIVILNSLTVLTTESSVSLVLIAFVS